MNPLIIQLITTLAPIFADAYRHYMADHRGEQPTTEQLTQQLLANIDRYTGEGSSWRSMHPDV